MDGGGSSVKKSITIDSASLIGNGTLKGKRPKRDKTARKLRPSSIIQPSVLKKTLLERIKQHQRSREQERSRTKDSEHRNENINDASNTNNSNERISSNTKIGEETFTTNFSKSMDFLQKLALKRQQTKTRRNNQPNRPNLTSSAISNALNIKTPEASMLNQVAETLTSGEIITNTGIIGLPINTYSESLAIHNHNNNQSIQNMTAAPLSMMNAPIINTQIQPSLFPAAVSTMYNNNNTCHSQASQSTNVIPNITELADVYNNTIAAASSSSKDTKSDNNTPITTNSNDTPLHVPENPESFLPSIFIKEEPPHGCLKEGKKPTFREWANKMLKKPVDTITNIFSGGGGDGGDNGNNIVGNSGGNSGGNSESNTGGGVSINNNITGENKIDPENIDGMRVKIRKTLKKKYRVGKHDNVVGVLLKNKESQQHIQKQHLTLKNKTIGDIRKHLYDKNLLKIGSNAPPDVLRRLYEDSILTGDVKNTSGNVLVHNFFSSE